jgi:hypothetical protein
MTGYTARRRDSGGPCANLTLLGADAMVLQPYFNISDQPNGFETRRSSTAQTGAGKTIYRANTCAKSILNCSKIWMRSNGLYFTELIRSQYDGGVSGTHELASTGLLPPVELQSSFDFRVRFTRDWIVPLRRRVAACPRAIFKEY